jgi:septum site-determining protein MinD
LENRIVYDLVDVVEGFAKLRHALIKDKRFDNLQLLPAAQTRDKTAVSPEQMRDLVETMKEEFDYVLIDSPAGIEQGFKNAIAGADKALVVATPEVSSVRDADRIIGLLEASDKQKPYLIINRIRPSMVKRGDMMDIDDMIEILAVELIGVVPEDEAIVVSTNRGEPAVMNQNSRAGEAYRQITQRLRGEDIPFPKLEEESTLFGRIRRMMGLKG